jgi:hypothetical protein
MFILLSRLPGLAPPQDSLDRRFGEEQAADFSENHLFDQNSNRDREYEHCHNRHRCNCRIHSLPP